jgi:hypothetical protein
MVCVENAATIPLTNRYVKIARELKRIPNREAKMIVNTIPK